MLNFSWKLGEKKDFFSPTKFMLPLGSVRTLGIKHWFSMPLRNHWGCWRSSLSHASVGGSRGLECPGDEESLYPGPWNHIFYHALVVIEGQMPVDHRCLVRWCLRLAGLRWCHSCLLHGGTVESCGPGALPGQDIKRITINESARDSAGNKSNYMLFSESPRRSKTERQHFGQVINITIIMRNRWTSWNLIRWEGQSLAYVVVQPSRMFLNLIIETSLTKPNEGVALLKKEK